MRSIGKIRYWNEVRVNSNEKNLNICLKSLINYIQMENCATIPMMGRFGKNCPKEKNKRMGGKML